MTAQALDVVSVCSEREPLEGDIGLQLKPVSCKLMVLMRIRM